ncbi:MAG TPA: cytochrome c oxidase subunit 3 [Steroidobacteraceae bacterium]|nr:cytochrome c oxidase subunit 3 [Steroidobacteraceae bacterium]
MSAHAAHFDSDARRHESALLGMWVFLATELMFFGPLFLSYAYGRVEFSEGFAAASRHTHFWIGTINTAVLLTSSFFMAAAVRAVKIDRRETAPVLLWITAALGTVFLAMKGVEYWSEWHEHLVPWLEFRFAPRHMQAAQFFYFIYFAMTGLHAVHLTIGIALAIIFAVRLQRRRKLPQSSVEIVGLYWHFVDAIWVFLYPLIYLLERHG